MDDETRTMLRDVGIGMLTIALWVCAIAGALYLAGFWGGGAVWAMETVTTTPASANGPPSAMEITPAPPPPAPRESAPTPGKTCGEGPHTIRIVKALPCPCQQLVTPLQGTMYSVNELCPGDTSQCVAMGEQAWSDWPECQGKPASDVRAMGGR